MSRHHPKDGLLTISRRETLTLLGAATAFTTAACFDQPREKILPYVSRPQGVSPNKALFYATSMVIDGYATGLLVESRDGRPTKIEGNPDHPASLGATRAFEQASVLDLYDPGRQKAPSFAGQPTTWQRFLDQIAVTIAQRRSVRIVMPPESSPTMGALLDSFRQHPDFGVTFYGVIDRRASRDATRLLFGRELDLAYDFRRARTVLSLDADFTCTMPNAIRWARDFAASRRIASPNDPMPRFYAVEPSPTPTGTLADERLAVRASEVPRVASAILLELLERGAGPDGAAPSLRAALRRSAGDTYTPFARAVASDLVASGGRAIVVAGDQQPRETHVLAILMNAALRSLGDAVQLQPTALLRPQHERPFEQLVDELEDGQVDTLVIIDADPVGTAPADLDLKALVGRVPTSVHLSLYADATSSACRWTLPLSHYLETWGDARAYDGTVSFIQPLVAPLYETTTAAAVLAAVAGAPATDPHMLLVDHWRKEWGKDFDAQWSSSIQLGLVPATAHAMTSADPAWKGVEEALRGLADARPSGVELRFPVSPCVYDGRFARNPWLQELPHPLTKHTWGNAAILGEALAARLGVENGDRVELRAQGRAVVAPVIVAPLQASDSIGLELGYGQTRTGGPIGVDAHALRTTAAPFALDGVEVVKVAGRQELPVTQDYGTQLDRPLALLRTLDRYRAEPHFTAELRGPVPTLLPVPERTTATQWAMTIDTMICTGCSACVIACQAENNIPVVGPEGVRRGREMHWLRIDRYFVGSSEGTQVVSQPMMCQHCEKAPCEYVCPVNATVHSPDGLNEMVYNRCIGTRFCSNNCPYKVRRFNWFDYERPAPTELQANPDVTVRERGVMEKCTYCVQRIRRAERAALVEKRPIAPGEVVTACQQACPTGAIQFGSLEHADATFVAWRAEERAYGVLHELGTVPRTQYLAKITNPNPEIER